MRSVTDAGIALIQRFEGFSALPYRCPAGYLTIGYGHLIGPGEVFSPQGITREEAELWLRHDVGAAERAVLRLIHVKLTDRQFDALVSFTFNLGAGALQRSTLRRQVNRGQHEDAGHEFLKWIWAGGRKLPGLLRRRTAEALRYRA